MAQRKIILGNRKVVLLILLCLVMFKIASFAQQEFNKNKTKELRKLCINMSCDDYKKVDFLIQKGADINKFHNIDKNIENPLFVASKNGCTKIVNLLLDANANVNASSTISLQERIQMPESKLEIIEGTNVLSHSNTIYAVKVTPLYIASQQGNLEIVKLLVNSGANINRGLYLESTQRNDFYTNKTPLFIAACNGHVDIVDFLISSNANVNAITEPDEFSVLYIASQKGHAAIVKLLLDAEADLEPCTRDFQTPLFIASKNGYTDIVRQLIRAGANVNASCTKTSFTPLYIATESEHIEVVKTLLEANADFNYKPEIQGASPLLMSIILGNTELTETLLNAGANIDVKIPLQDIEITSISLSQKIGITEFTLLLEIKEPLITPLSLAKKLGRTETVELLQNIDKTNKLKANELKANELKDLSKKHFQRIQNAINTAKPFQVVEFSNGDYAKNIAIKSPGSILIYDGAFFIKDDGLAFGKIPSKGEDWHWITNEDFLILKIKNFPKQPDDIIADHNEVTIPVGFIFNKLNELIIVFPKEITPCSFEISGVFEDKLIIPDKK